MNRNDNKATKPRLLKLYRYNKVIGYWIVERQVTAYTAKDWLDLYALDSPDDWFYVGKIVPKLNPKLLAASR